ncbi:MAG: adenylate cyclase [Crocinitomicaceae bacterium]|jgi:adenylate cyclase
MKDKEIEYKYLVDSQKWEAADKPIPELIVQGFLTKSIDCTVRVRIKGSKAYLTIKGKTVGISRTEFEYEIPVEDAENMISEFISKSICKKRYEIPFEGRTWEVDVFEGHLSGLILAELEVDSEEERFNLPEWATENVSEDKNYYNAILIDRDKW